MKVKKTSGNNASVEIEGEHTHTMFFADTEKANTPFKEVHLTYSDFPEGHQGIEVSTFDNGDIYIGIPKNLDIQLRLISKSGSPKP